MVNIARRSWNELKLVLNRYMECCYDEKYTLKSLNPN